MRQLNDSEMRIKSVCCLFVLVLLIGSFYLGWYFGQHGIPFLKKQVEFSIGIYQGNSPLEMSSKIKNPVLTKEDVTDIDALFVADPFMINVNSTWYMFFEVKNSYDHQTDIAYATSEDGFNWDYQEVILNEQFPQSYPYVFEWEGEYYMLPESYATNSIRIYRAWDFPRQWILEDILITGRSYVDPTIFRYDDKWWIFASTPKNEDLYLFYADYLSGTWTEHPMSPIIEGDKNIARPGGRVIEYNGSLYRYTQDDEPYYGNQVWAFEIIKLTIEEYEEKEVGIILNKGGTGWRSKGMHNIDPHQLNENEWIACVDGYKQSIIWEN